MGFGVQAAEAEGEEMLESICVYPVCNTRVYMYVVLRIPSTRGTVYMRYNMYII